MNGSHPAVGENPKFPKTRWSLVLRSQLPNGGKEAEKALSEICELYWYPIYAYLRWLGANANDLEDLTQGYFQRLLSKELLQDLREENGRLRSFLRVTVKRHYIDQTRHATAQRRGGNATMVFFDAEEADQRFHLESASTLTPERQFERRWAESVLESVMSELGREYKARGRGEIFAKLRDQLSWNCAESPQTELADSLGMSVGALRMNILRMRQRYGEILRAQILETVAIPEEVDGEISYLFSLFREEAA
jgi:RNA polymerase sigma-70 factor (ECF subfamily)